jgi:hypothetical protein
MCVYEHLLHAFTVEKNANAIPAPSSFFRWRGGQHSTAGFATNLASSLFERNCGGSRELSRPIGGLEKVGAGGQRIRREYKHQPD